MKVDMPLNNRNQTISPSLLNIPSFNLDLDRPRTTKTDPIF